MKLLVCSVQLHLPGGFQACECLCACPCLESVFFFDCERVRSVSQLCACVCSFNFERATHFGTRFSCALAHTEPKRLTDIVILNFDPNFSQRFARDLHEHPHTHTNTHTHTHTHHFFEPQHASLRTKVSRFCIVVVDALVCHKVCGRVAEVCSGSLGDTRAVTGTARAVRLARRE